MTPVFRAALAVLLSNAPAQDGHAGREVVIALDGIAHAATCPSVAVLARALDAHLPGITSAGQGGPGHEPDLLRLRLDDGGAEVVHFALVDVAGQTILERTLAAPGNAPDDRVGACAALAETIALVAERYVRHLGYRAPAGAAPPDLPTTAVRVAPSAVDDPARPLGWLMLAAGASVAPARRGPTRIEPELAVDLLVAPIVLSLRAAFSWPIEVVVPSTDHGVFRYAALPLRAGVGFPARLPGGAGWAAVTALVGVDLFRAETRDIAVPRQIQGVEPVAELGLYAALRVGHRLALRPQILLDLRPERAFQLQDPALAGSPVFVDGGFSLRVGFDAGFAFGKN